MTDDRIERQEILERRMLVFAANVIRKLERDKNISLRIADQLIRSSSSIGANYAEARNAVSRLDFRNKVYIAKKEAAETRFWIDLCIELTSDESWRELRKETHSLVLVLQVIANSVNERKPR